MTDTPLPGKVPPLILLPFFAGEGAYFAIRFGLIIPLAATVPFFLLVLTLASFKKGRPLALLLVPFCFFISAGQRTKGLSIPDIPGHLANKIHSPTEVGLIGTVTTMISRGSERSRMTIECERLITGRGKEEGCRGLVRLTAWGKIPQGIMPGDRIGARALLRPVSTIMTPGVGNFRLVLAEKGIWTTGTIRKNILMKLPGGPSSPVRTVERIRQKMALALSRNVADRKTAAVYRAILLGDSSDIPITVRRQFTRSGTIHLLAISGMHLGIIFLALTLTFRFLLGIYPPVLLKIDGWKASAILSLAPLGAYALLAGLNPPVFRALIMITVLIYAIGSDRRHHILSAIALAATIIILARPAAVTRASFQLSFAAVTAIVLAWQRLYPWFQNLTRGNRTLRFFIGAGLAGIAAQAGTTPFAIFHFNQFSPLSIPMTVVLLPLICLWALPLGLCALIALPVSPSVTGILLKIGSAGIRAAIAITSPFWAGDSTIIYGPTPPLLLIGIYLIALLLIFIYLRRPCPFLIAFIILPYVFLGLNRLLPAVVRIIHPSPTISFLDIGPGSSTVITTPAGKSWLIDGGGISSPGFDPGRRIIAPFLFSKGITRIDGVVISHPHADHYNGLASVIEIFHPTAVWINGKRGKTDYRRLLALATKKRITIRTARAGETIFKEKEARLDCIKDGESGKGTNGSSLVLVYTQKDHGVIFPGDLPPQEQKNLAARGRLPECDLLLAPHHGSPAYFTDDILKATRTKTVIISKGSTSPLAEQWAHWQGQTRGKLLITSRDGTIEAQLSPTGISYRLPWRGFAMQ